MGLLAAAGALIVRVAEDVPAGAEAPVTETVSVAGVVPDSGLLATRADWIRQ